MSAESLSLISGMVLSLVFSYVPGARSWFEKFDPETKRSIMLVLLAITASIVFGLSCVGWTSEWSISLSCNRSDLLRLIEQLVLAIIANQSVYAISPRKNRNSSPPIHTALNS
jgi:FtsH-binding integral membrane protein